MKKTMRIALAAVLLAGCGQAAGSSGTPSVSPAASAPAASASAAAAEPVTAKTVSVTGCAYLLDTNPEENYVALIIEGNSNAEENGFTTDSWRDFSEAMKDYIYDGPISTITSEGSRCADPGNSNSQSVSMLTIRKSDDYTPIANVIASFNYQFRYKLADGTEGEISPAIAFLQQ
jgi:hypothetical protein